MKRAWQAADGSRDADLQVKALRVAAIREGISESEPAAVTCRRR